MKTYVVCVDVAKKRDYYANMVFKSRPEVADGNPLLQTPDRVVQHYDIVFLDKAKELRYPDMVERVKLITNHVDLKNDHDLIVDGTGVGEAAVDYMRDEGMYPIPIVFTGGDHMNMVYSDMGQVFSSGSEMGHLKAAKVLKEIRVPKQDLVTAGSILIQQGRVHLSKGVRYREDVENQFMGFIGKVNENTGRKKYEADDEETHDDFVVCYLMGSWWMMHRGNVAGVKERVLPEGRAFEKSTVWEPSDYL